MQTSSDVILNIYIFVCNKGPCLCFSAEHQAEEESLAVNRG